jgi:uncharacterized protein (TIGR02145 family)
MLIKQAKFKRSLRGLLSVFAAFILLSCVGCNSNNGPADPPPEPQTGTVADIDGNIYRTIKIGNQWWLAENLKVTHYRNGDGITYAPDPSAWANLTVGGYSAYDNSQNNAATYGMLYNWYAVNDPRGLAPAGWHVPSDAEWKQLEMYLGMNQAEADRAGSRGTDEGGKLKESGTTHWASPNVGANNESGFSALAGGSRGSGGDFYDFGEYASFQSSSSSSEFGLDESWCRHLFYANSRIHRYHYSKTYGWSVRCVKD